MKKFLLFPLFTLLLGNALTAADDLKLIMSSRLDVISEQDAQSHFCETFLFKNETLFDNPNILRLFEKNAYQFSLQFAYFGKKPSINQANFQEAGYTVKAAPTGKSNLVVQGQRIENGKISVFILMTGPVQAKDTLQILLFSPDKKMIASARYPLAIMKDEPSPTGLSLFKIQMPYEPLIVRVSERDNPRNLTQKELFFFGDTIEVNGNKTYDILFEYEKWVDLNGTAFVVVADTTQDYGYNIQMEWDRNLKVQPLTESGMHAEIKTPARPSPIDNSGLQLAEKWFTTEFLSQQLPLQGKRLKCEIVPTDMPANRKYFSDLLLRDASLLQQRMDLATPSPQTEHKKNLEKEMIQKAYIMDLQNQNLWNQELEMKYKPSEIDRSTGNEPSDIRMERRAREYRVTDQTQVSGPIREKTVTRETPAASPATKMSRYRDRMYTSEAAAERRVSQPPPIEEGYYSVLINMCREMDVVRCHSYRVVFHVRN